MSAAASLTVGAPTAAAAAAVTSSATDDAGCRRTLYWGSGSPPAWRVRLLLEEKEIAYKSHLISFEDGELQTPLMRSLNPRALVPIFVDADVVIYESLAILHYVEAKLDSDRPSLLPRHDKHYARMLVRMQESNNVSATVGEVVYYIRRTKPDEINETYLQAKITQLHQEVSLWERYLESGDDYLAGMDMTLADVAFFPSLAYMVRLGFDLARYPRLHSYYGRLCLRKSVLASWPPHWLTSEGAVPLRGV